MELVGVEMRRMRAMNDVAIAMLLMFVVAFVV
jgi:hypothetical protein